MKKFLAAVVVIAAILVVTFFAFRTPDIPAAELRAKYTTDASEFITVEAGLDVHVRDEGPAGAPALMLLHGSSASLQTWDPWVKLLSGTYRVITYDQPGHGLTGPHPRRCYTAECMTAVADAVARAKGLRNFVIGGNSMGGWVAWQYALRYPDRLAGLILVDAAGVDLPSDSTPIGFIVMRTPLVNRIAQTVTPRAMVATSLKSSVADPDRVTDKEIDRYWELLRYPGNRAATGDRFRASRGEPASIANLSRIDVPTLIMWGDQDTLIPVEAAESFAAALPVSTTVIYENIGHIPQEETPERSAADVASFLRRIYPPRPGFAAIDTP